MHQSRAVSTSGVRGPQSAVERLRALGRDRARAMDALAYVVQSSGWLVRRAERSIWAHGATATQFHLARPLIEQVMRTRPHTRFVGTSIAASTLHYVARTFPDEQASPLPWESARAARRFLGGLNPGLVLLLDAGRTLGPVATRETLRSGIPIVVLLSEPADSIAPHLLTLAQQHPAQMVWCVATTGDRAWLVERGIAGDRHVHCTGRLAEDATLAAAQPRAGTIRRLLGVPDETKLVIGIDVPEHETALVLDAFHTVKTTMPHARLVVAPHAIGQASRIVRRCHTLGWTCRRRITPLDPSSPDWDVLVEEVPGEALSLLPAATVILIGGSWSASADPALRDLAHAAGPAVLGGDSPPDDLQTALASAVSSARPAPPARRSTATANCLAALDPFLPASPALPLAAQAWRVPTRRERAGASAAWRAVAPLLRAARYDDAASLGARLGHPRSLLCLGNGPSSEQPGIADIEHDCLFRVNWRWRTRGVLTTPDVVFVGDPASIHKLSGCIFAVWTIEMEYGMLLRNLATHGPRRIELVTLERLSPLVGNRQWPARPTNGALMIVLAAALQPERLVIGGLDLFQHPDGRYPGDVIGTNHYSRVHARETDLALIRLALHEYRGELVVLSEALREALAVDGAVV